MRCKLLVDALLIKTIKMINSSAQVTYFILSKKLKQPLNIKVSMQLICGSVKNI